MKPLFFMHPSKQTGGTVVGLIVGVVLGLGVALLVAIYVTKLPVPFLNKGATFTNKQESDEAQKNKNWDPNTPLYDKNSARAGVAPAAVPAVGPAATPVWPDSVAVPPPARGASAPDAAASAPVGKPATAALGDPLGDLAKARAGAQPAAAAVTVDPFDYFVQAGAFRTQVDADAQRAKLAMLGWEARVSQREQSGRTVFRVRIGPFVKRVDADQLKEKLDGAGVETALVRVQR